MKRLAGKLADGHAMYFQSFLLRKELQCLEQMASFTVQGFFFYISLLVYLRLPYPCSNFGQNAGTTPQEREKENKTQQDIYVSIL